MPSGKFTLYRRDGHGNDVPCAGVRYRILDVLQQNEVVATGSTDAHGDTATVVLPDREPEPTPPPARPGAVAWPLLPAPLKTVLWPRRKVHEMRDRPGTPTAPGVRLPASQHRYALQVREAATGQWGDPLLHTAQRTPVELGTWSDDPAAAAELRPAWQVRRLRMRPFHQFQFQSLQPLAPVPNAPYVAYTTGRDGRQTVASSAEGRPVRGVTDPRGFTPRIFCEHDAWVVFSLPGTALSFAGNPQPPQVSGQDLQIHLVPLKTQSSVAGPGDGTVVELMGKTSAPAILNAADEELLLLTPEVWKEFEALTGYLENTMAAVPRARLNLEQALRGRDLQAIAQAEKDLNLAEDRAARMLNSNLARKADLVEVITFESYSRPTPGQAGDDNGGLRRRYLPRFKYEEFKGRRVMGVPTRVDLGVSARHKGSVGGLDLSGGAAAKQGGAAFDAFDKKKFLASLASIQLKVEDKWSTDPFVWDAIHLGGNQISKLIHESDDHRIEASAQWLRFVAGAGASAQAVWDPVKRKASAQLAGNVRAKIVFLEGKCLYSWYVPTRTGWIQRYGDMDLGAIVFQMELELHGFAGVRFALMGAAGVTTEGGKAKVKPQARDRDDSFVPAFDVVRGMPRADMGDPPGPDGKPSSRVVMAPVGEKPPEELNGMKLDGDAFIGGEIGLAPAGELQWLPPDQQRPVTVARLSLDIAGNVGAGAKAQIFMYYAQGHFRIKVSARLCVGYGGRGALDFVVDADSIFEFVKWVYYQLAHSGFRKLVFFAKDAFESLSKMMFMLIAEESSLGRILREKVEEIDFIFRDLISRLDVAGSRNKLVRRINALPRDRADSSGTWLIYATPETRGMLLYAITRHDWSTHMKSLPEAQGWFDPQVHYLAEHKEAVLRIVKGVKLVAEWVNMFQHMTLDGSKSSESPDKLEGDVVRFLNYGMSLTGDLAGQVIEPINAEPGAVPEDVGNTYLEAFTKHRATLIGLYPKGYEVVQLDGLSVEGLRALDGAERPGYAQVDPQHTGINRDAIETLIAFRRGEHGDGPTNS